MKRKSLYINQLSDRLSSPSPRFLQPFTGRRPGQRNLLRTPAWRVSRGMGDRACGSAGLPPRRFVSAVRRAKVPPQGFSEARTGPYAHHFTSLG